MSTIKKYSAGIANICKGAALLGNNEAEFMVRGMTILQIITIEEAMRAFGIEMTHELVQLPDGGKGVHFYADVSKLRLKLEELEDFGE